jgi:hypothetical protein
MHSNPGTAFHDSDVPAPGVGRQSGDWMDFPFANHFWRADCLFHWQFAEDGAGPHAPFD